MNDDALWTVVSLAEELYAIPVDDVQTMVMLPPVSKMPNMPEHVRGVFLLRGNAVPALDLRARLGIPSLLTETEDLLEMLRARQQDHENWLNELEASVAEGREFKLTTDPHKCAFGKWYDLYEADNLVVAGLLKKFDAPHKRIHGIAEEVLALEKAGDMEAARSLLAHTRDGDLARMIQLFGQLREQVQETTREIAIVLRVDDDTFAVTVDSVMTVSRLQQGSAEDIEHSGIVLSEKGLVSSVAKVDKTGQLVIVLDPKGIIAGRG